ncbi:cell envelope-related transcriptional attenuator [Xylanimonas cellulosilytica DSM 15894]|uniref:Cell envelope-related transcriptional attenuator n=1 Tax=Xylanimonas cellulosilytica (strain DSM 15894 / JCM 12276 / CECT 5975 / KCTC 9989 / LMG 20990 / NBRC 107835 / XIL07) TaxID=446471 RepID=D1BX40_XYLCX|nr:cell envelope-related transcriptional attenuator [Xylanimonas cellulosilytica DSM 15894]
MGRALGAPDDDAAPRLPSHARSFARHRVARSVGMVLTGVLAFGTAGGATAAITLSGNIDKVNVDEALGGIDRPDVVVPEDPNAGTPLNIVLMGSDTRSGENGNYAASEGTGGARADTTMILHLSADRTRAELVSIPRDTTVDIPACPTSDGRMTVPWRGTKFNASFAQGYTKGKDVASGALCTMATIESLTDVRMDGFVVIDFAGFQKMIDALGGVPICIPERIEAPEAGNLVLEAGQQTLDGGTALQYARARKGKGLGDGSDIGRIGRQQRLMSELANTVLSKNLLVDSPALLQFLGATTSSLTMSSNFASVQGLAGLAYSLRNVRPATITFMTVPWGADPNNSANVLWTGEADVLWDNLRNDRPITTPAGAADEPVAPVDAETETPADAATTPAATAEPTPATEPTTEAEASTPTPTPTETTAEAGKEAFTGADVTAVCG